MLLKLLFAAFGCVLFVASCCCVNAQSVTRTVVFSSDMHLDPFYGTGKGYKCTDQSTARSNPYGVYGCDSPAALIDSFVSDAGSLAPYMALFGGDWQRHGMSDLPTENYDSVFSQAAQYMSRLQSATSSGASLAAATGLTWTLGNNDVIPDYYLTTDRKSLPVFRSLGNLLQNASLLSVVEKAMFSVCGLYYRDVGSVLRVIVLNTLVWSVSLSPAVADDETDPCSQFSFLEQYLGDAVISRRKVIILGHIPPGLNMHGALFSGLPPATWTSASESKLMFWKQRFQNRFISLMRNYSRVITYCVFGHAHMTSFIANPALLPVPILLVPSLTPLFGNNPTYLMAVINDTTWLPSKLQQRVFSFSKQSWSNGADFSTFLASSTSSSSTTGPADLAALSAANSQWLSAAYASQAAGWSDFLTLYSSGMTTSANIFPGGSCDDGCSRLLQCATRYLSLSDLAQCVGGEESPLIEKSIAAATVAFTVISTIIFLGGFVYLFWHRKSILDGMPGVLKERHLSAGGTTAERIELITDASVDPQQEV